MPEIAIQTAGGTRERYPLAKDRVTVGRSRDSDIFLPDQWLSRHHAAIEERADGYWVSDLNSKNGTLLNGEPVRDWRRLRPGDVITLGEHTLTFCAEAEEDEEEDREPEGTRVFSVRELLRDQHPARHRPRGAAAAEPRARHPQQGGERARGPPAARRAVRARPRPPPRGGGGRARGDPPPRRQPAPPGDQGLPLAQRRPAHPGEPLDRAAGHGGARLAPPAERPRGRALQAARTPSSPPASAPRCARPCGSPPPGRAATP